MMDELIEFRETDIIVFDGAITTYGVIKHLINEDCDEVRFATAEEVRRWDNRPESTPINR